jgi:hypothetical protein
MGKSVLCGEENEDGNSTSPQPQINLTPPQHEAQDLPESARSVGSGEVRISCLLSTGE